MSREAVPLTSCAAARGSRQRQPRPQPQPPPARQSPQRTPRPALRTAPPPHPTPLLLLRARRRPSRGGAAVTKGLRRPREAGEAGEGAVARYHTNSRAVLTLRANGGTVRAAAAGAAAAAAASSPPPPRKAGGGGLAATKRAGVRAWVVAREGRGRGTSRRPERETAPRRRLRRPQPRQTPTAHRRRRLQQALRPGGAAQRDTRERGGLDEPCGCGGGRAAAAEAGDDPAGAQPRGPAVAHATSSKHNRCH